MILFPGTLRMASAIRLLLLISVGFSLACGTDAVLLPSDFNTQKVKQVVIDYSVEEGVVTNLGGVHGGPLSPVPSDSLLLDLYRYAHVDAVRVPQGYLCDYTLSGIFPDAAADPEDQANYNFEKIDEVLTRASQVGGKVVWQAIYDIGDTCEVQGNGLQKVRRPADREKWLTVVKNSLLHFNRVIVNPNSPWYKAARDFFVNHVEFIDEPLASGAYANISDYVDDFVALGALVKDVKTFPLFETNEPFVKLIGPSMVIESAASVANHPLLQFVDELKAQNALKYLDILSFKTRVDSPEQNKLIADAIKQALVSRGVEIPLWAISYKPSDAVNTLPSKTDEFPRWSAFAGAFATATKIKWQGVVQQAMFYRGDRRYLDENTNDITNVEHTPLWTPTATMRPAGITWLPWALFKNKIRIKVDPLEELDRPGMAVIASKCLPQVKAEEGQTGDSTAESACSDTNETIYLLIANANTQLKSAQVTYQIMLKNIGENGLANRQATVRRAVINDSTTEFRFASERLEAVVDGVLTYTVQTSVPATDYLQIELMPQEPQK